MNPINQTHYANDKTNKLKYIAYVRKSTEEDDRQALSIDAQVDAIKSQFPNLDITFIKGDDGATGESMSAAKPGRILFNKMVGYMNSGKYQGIIAWHPDRLSRNMPDAATIIWSLQQNVIKDIRFCNFTFEKTPEGILMLQMIMSQAQYFSAKLSKDVRRGNAAKRRMGGLTGIAPNGYLNDKATCTVVKDPERFPLVRKAFDLFLTGNHSVHEICEIMDEEWGYTTPKRQKVGGTPISLPGLHHMFRNIRYAGVIEDPHTGEQFPAAYEPILTHEEYDKVQDLLGRKGLPRLCKRNKTFALKGFIKCGECGYTITAEEKQKKLKDGRINIHTYYHCTHKGKTRCSQRKNIKENDLYGQLIILLDSYELIPELHEISLKALDEIAKKEISERNGVQSMQNASIKKVQNQLDRLLELATRDLITADEYEIKSTSLKIRLEKLQHEQKYTADRTRNWYEIMGNTLSELESVNEKFADGNVMEKRRILSAIGQNPILTDGVLSVDEHYWLRPLKENKQRITDELEKVRTEPQQMKNDLKQVIYQQWCGWRESNSRLELGRLAY